MRRAGQRLALPAHVPSTAALRCAFRQSLRIDQYRQLQIHFTIFQTASNTDIRGLCCYEGPGSSRHVLHGGHMRGLGTGRGGAGQGRRGEESFSPRRCSLTHHEALAHLSDALELAQITRRSANTCTQLLFPPRQTYFCHVYTCA